MQKNDFKKVKKAGYSFFSIWIIGCVLKFLSIGSKRGFQISDDMTTIFMALLAVAGFVAFMWFISKNERDEEKSENAAKKEDENVETQYYKDWQEGFSFDTVEIGNQVWMAQDLEEGGSKHPYLDKNVVLPRGWHVPTLEDFQELQKHLKSRFSSDIDIACFLEKNWYRKELPDDTCSNCGGCGVINDSISGLQECPECGGSGFVHDEKVSELFWTNEEERDGSIVCACLQKREFSFCTVSDDSIVHLRLIKER